MTDYSIGGSSGTTGLSPWASPTPAGKLVAVDPVDFVTNPHGSAGADKWLSIGQLLGVAGYVFPSGDTSGHDDRVAINAVIGANGICKLIAANYYIDQPLVPGGSTSAAAAIIGEYAGWGTDNDFYGTGSGIPTGTQIIAAGGFAGQAAILCDNETSTQYMAPTFRNFVLNCESMPAQAGGVAGNGIELTGPWAAATWENLLVFKPQGNCIVAQDATGAGSGNPDNMIFRAIKTSGARGAGGTGGTGMSIIHCPDFVASDCESSECAGSAWLVGAVTNGMISNCKGENSLRGWHFGGFFSSGSYLVLSQITSNENDQDGMLFDQVVGSGAGQYVLVGGKATNDGQSGAGFAGYRATGCPSTIQGEGLLALGNSYGVLMGSASNAMAVIGNFSGSTAAAHDDGSNTTPLAVLQMSGTWAFTGPAAISAGTATAAPLKFASGTLLTAAAAGAAEFDGTAFYATAAASSRQVIDAEQFTCLSGSYTLTNSTAAQKLFNATANGTLTVAGSTAYWLDAEFEITGLSGSAHTISFGFGGTATVTSIKYLAERLDSSTAFSTAQAWTKQTVTAAGATALTAAGVTTTGFAARISGMIRINAGGTLIPQITMATNAAAAVVSANSWIRLTAVGSNTVTNVGDWS